MVVIIGKFRGGVFFGVVRVQVFEYYQYVCFSIFFFLWIYYFIKRRYGSTWFWVCCFYFIIREGERFFFNFFSLEILQRVLFFRVDQVYFRVVVMVEVLVLKCIQSETFVYFCGFGETWGGVLGRRSYIRNIWEFKESCGFFVRKDVYRYRCLFVVFKVYLILGKYFVFESWDCCIQRVQVSLIDVEAFRVFSFFCFCCCRLTRCFFAGGSLLFRRYVVEDSCFRFFG